MIHTEHFVFFMVEKYDRDTVHDTHTDAYMWACAWGSEATPPASETAQSPSSKAKSLEPQDTSRGAYFLGLCPSRSAAFLLLLKRRNGNSNSSGSSIKP